MTLIFCLDNHNGIMFNNRRQSADKAVTDRILNYADGHKLLIDTYSAKLLPAAQVYTGHLPDETVVFAETGELVDLCINRADKLIVYKWNRGYPSDVYVPIEKITDNWRLETSVDFSGNSHDLITEEVYVRE